MKITKIGHCCLVIEIDNARFLTDPGAYSEGQGQITGLDAVIITHEHPDHLHLESLTQVLANNPNVAVITNAGVGAKLAEAGIPHTIVQGREKTEVKGVVIEAYDCKHEEIYEQIGQVQNTGYFIGEKLFYPGDSFYNPQRPVDVLALPVAGPWCKLSDAIRYALKVKPKKAFAVHDAALVPARSALYSKLPQEILPNTEEEENGFAIRSTEPQATSGGRRPRCFPSPLSSTARLSWASPTIPF